jgi:hypothetical protein
MDLRSLLEVLNRFKGRPPVIRGFPFENLLFLTASDRRKLTLIDHSKREKDFVCVWPQSIDLEPKGEE